ncbi:ribonuclease H-like domain-containing protein, partial [Tanacetum coccineum]
MKFTLGGCGFGIKGIKLLNTPVDTESQLGVDGAPAATDHTLYRSLACALQYLMFTRPVPSYVLRHVCRYMHDHQKPHVSALKKILRYVSSTLDYSLQLYSSFHSSLIAYLDADLTGFPTTRCSTLGIVCFLATIYYHGLQSGMLLSHDLAKDVSLGRRLLTDIAVLCVAKSTIDIVFGEMDKAWQNTAADLIGLPDDLSVGFCIRAREVTISCTVRLKPLALPWGRTPRLDSGMKSPQSSMILLADYVLRAVINARLPVPLLLLVCFWSYLFHAVILPYQVGDVPLT